MCNGFRPLHLVNGLVDVIAHVLHRGGLFAQHLQLIKPQVRVQKLIVVAGTSDHLAIKVHQNRSAELSHLDAYQVAAGLHNIGLAQVHVVGLFAAERLLHQMDLAVLGDQSAQTRRSC